MKRERLTPYEKWMANEGIPIVSGWAVEDVLELGRVFWARLNGKGAFIHLEGMEGVTGMYVVEIPPGAELNPEKHIFEEIIYVLQGQGGVEIWQEGGEKNLFEWQRGSLFSPPLNTWHKLFNGSSQPAVLLAATNAPLLMDAYHNQDFMFNCDYRFVDRYGGSSGFFRGNGDRYQEGKANIWETNFIADVGSAHLDSQEGKVAGGSITQFQMADNGLVGHIADWPVGRYHKAHYHGGGAIILILKSFGYTLMWPNEIGTQPYKSKHGDQIIKMDWVPGGILSPPTGWFHQHFNVGKGSARQLAFRYGGRKYIQGLRRALGKGVEGVYTSTEEGGTLIEYKDEDPNIRIIFEKALTKEGISVQMPGSPS